MRLLGFKIKSSITKTTRTGNFSTFTITESTDFYINASITHSSGTIPLTAKENEYTIGQITANTITMESKHITGYINGLYYGCSNEIKSVNNIAPTARIINQIIVACLKLLLKELK